MCLGIPMQILRIDGYTAHCEAKGSTRDVSLLMLQDEELSEGDFLVINLGYAIEKISPEAARSAWEIYDQLLAAQSGSDDE